MGENTEDLDILFRQAALKAQARAEKAEKALAKGRFSNLYRTRDKFSYSQFCAQRAQVRAKQKRRQKQRKKQRTRARVRARPDRRRKVWSCWKCPLTLLDTRESKEQTRWPPVPTAKNAKKKEKKEEDHCDSLVGHANHEKL